MTLPELEYYPSRSAIGIAGGLFYRRDNPEIIIPTLATPGINVFGAADVLSAYTQIIAATPQTLAVIGITLGFRNTLTTAAGAGGTFQQMREGRFMLGVGAAGGEVRVAEGRCASNILTLVQNPGATTTVTTGDTLGVLFPIGPISIVSGSRIAYRGAFNDAFGSGQTRLYLVCLPTTFSMMQLPQNMQSFMLGQVATDSVTTDYTVVSKAVAAWSFGAWTTLPIKGLGTADQEYLVNGVQVNGQTSVLGDYQFDLGIGIAGSEVVQSRIAQPGSNGFYYGSRRNTPWIPFRLHAGERLACRMAGSPAFADNAIVTCDMIAL